MARTLEKRIQKLEKAMGGRPCDKPGHSDFMLFITKQHEAEVSAEDQAKIDSIRACEKCKHKPVVILTHFDPDYDGLFREQPKPRPITFAFGQEEKPKPEPVEQPKEEPLAFPAPWLSNILTIGDGDD